ncbi:MAG: penicillin-binding protein 2 [Patescibacteria group bacterium]
MTPNPKVNELTRVRIWYALLILITVAIVVRLFFLQVIRYDYYSKAALSKQLKQYEIPADRGHILAHDGRSTTSLVLNETKYTVFADPKFITNPKDAARDVQRIIGGDAGEIEKKMQSDSRYVVLAKKLDKNQKQKINDLKINGLGTREVPVRTYPQSQLAAQLLGFVDDEGIGKYGVEEALNDELKGAPGELKAITDAQGVPLASNKDNIIKDPKAGDSLLLTIDVGIQKRLEDILKQGLDIAKSSSGSALIMDPNSGAVKAIANYPTYNPAEFFKVEQKDQLVFTNAAVSAPLEVGSVMKSFTAAAAIDMGVVSKNTSYFDPSQFKVGDKTITNIEEDGGAAQRTVADILQLSLNTGATWLLMQMGGGEINEQARTRWHDYLTNHYQFGKLTGIEQGYEAPGVVPHPTEGFGLNIQFANTAFGQGMTNTPLQLGAALSSIINGGKYYKPHLVEKRIKNDGTEIITEKKVVREKVVSDQVSSDMRDLMENVISKNYLVYGMKNLRQEFRVGGKTGTAEVPKPGGGYYDDRFNGTFIGYVGGDTPEYVIIVRVNEPKIDGYAGARAAAPIFVNLTNMLIDSFGVTPKSQ